MTNEAVAYTWGEPGFEFPPSPDVFPTSPTFVTDEVDSTVGELFGWTKTVPASGTWSEGAYYYMYMAYAGSPGILLGAGSRSTFAIAYPDTFVNLGVFQWEYIDPGNPALGKRRSNTLCPGGLRLYPNDSVDWSGKNLTKAYLSGVSLQFANLDYATLTDADLSQTNLTGASLKGAPLAGADLIGATVIGANMELANVSGVTFIEADLSTSNLYNVTAQSGDFTNANLSNTNLNNSRLDAATLGGANFTGASVTNASFNDTTSRGFTAAQLYSTASYQARNLGSIRLDNNDLQRWSFSGQELSYASFQNADLRGADLTQAQGTNTNFVQSMLVDADFSQANLANANFNNSKLSRAKLNEANLASASLYSADLSSADLSQANIQNADLRNADLRSAVMNNVDLTGADIRGANFSFTTDRGFTAANLYSTASYQAKDLTATLLAENNLSGWNFAGQNLTGASFVDATLTGVDLSAATVVGANFSGTTGARGFTAAQLYSTASYQAGDLSGLVMARNDLTGWNFADQNLTNAEFGRTVNGQTVDEAVLTGTDFTGADMRGATASSVALTNAITTNTIRPDGHMSGLNLSGGQVLVVRDYDGNERSDPITPPIPIRVDQQFVMGPGGTVRMVFDADAWDSTVSFAPNIPMTRGGNLELTFAPGVDVATQVGRPIDLFDWAGVSPTGEFTLVSPHHWDLSKLYTTGEVRVLPSYGEPSILEGLAAHYRLDDTTGDVIDSAGSYHGTNYGATRGVPGVFGAAFEFDVAGDYVRTGIGSIDGNSVSYPDGITIQAWVKTTDSDGGGIVVSRGWGAGAGSQFLGLNVGPDGRPTMNLFLGDPALAAGVVANTPVNDNQWHHVVGSYDGSYLSIYVDGVRVSLPASGTAFSADVFKIGWDDDGPQGYRFFNGIIDDVRIWDRALSSTEVAILQFFQEIIEGVFQWEYIDPGNPALGKRRSNTLCPDGFGLHPNDSVDWPGKNLTKAYLSGVSLRFANLDYATLTDADLSQTNLTGASFMGAALAGADLTGATVVGANLTNAEFGRIVNGETVDEAILTGTDFTGADMRGATSAALASAITTNTIRPDGHISGLNLSGGQVLVVRDYDGDARDNPVTPPIPIHVDQQFVMGPGGTLRMVFDADAWESTISFAPNIPVTRGGTLELTFAAGVALSIQVGRTIDLFDWADVSPTGEFTVVSPHRWDLSNLYTTGKVTLLPSHSEPSIPEGLIAHYRLDDTTGDVIDSAGSYHGTNYGAIRGVPGVFNAAFEFDVAGDYVSTGIGSIDGNSVSYPDGITIQAWVKTTDSDGGGIVVSRGPGDGAGSQFLGLNVGPNGIPGMNLFLGNPSAFFAVNSNTPINDNQWHHVLGSYDGSNLSIYVDGVGVSQPASGTAFSADVFKIGWDDFGGEGYRFFTGIIDDVRIWNRALSAAEVASLLIPPGNYNGDGTVDAADYVVWRKNGGTQEQYNTWRANFGNTFGSGASISGSESSPAVPEPTSLLLFGIASVMVVGCQRRNC